MTHPISQKRAVLSILLAWFIFIGIDFLFHASILSPLWNEEIPALKPLQELALLIPAGYLSFLLLTALVGFVFFKIFRTKPATKKVFLFGFVFALLFSLSNFLGLYSYIDLPLKQLAAFNLVYFIEILAVTMCIYHLTFNLSIKRAILGTVLIFASLVIVGILIQNVIANA